MNLETDLFNKEKYVFKLYIITIPFATLEYWIIYSEIRFIASYKFSSL